MKYSKLILLFLILFIDSSLQAQAWTKSKRGAYLQVGYNYIAGQQIYNNSGPSIQLPYDVQDFTYAAYMQYGLSNKFTLTANLPFKMAKTHGELHTDTPLEISIQEGQLNGVGNIGVGLVYGIRQNQSFVVSAKLNVDLPTAQFSEATGLRTGYDTYGIAPFLNFGYSKNGIFSSLHLGLNIRGNEYSEQLLNTFEIGTQLGEKLYLILGHELLLSMNNGNFDDATTNQTGLYANDTEFQSYSLKTGYNITPTWIAWLYLSGGYKGNAVFKIAGDFISHKLYLGLEKRHSNSMNIPLYSL